jgi:benzil reductase ((S)-benzoin forming)
VNVSSGAAGKGYAGWNLYCAGKAAVENYLSAVHEEEKTEAHPYRVFSVNPHIMDTGMQRLIRESEESEFPQKSRFVKFKEHGQLLPAKTVAATIMELVGNRGFADFKFDVKSHLDAQAASAGG